jgi:hypothetical protein
MEIGAELVGRQLQVLKMAFSPCSQKSDPDTAHKAAQRYFLLIRSLTGINRQSVYITLSGASHPTLSDNDHQEGDNTIRLKILAARILKKTPEDQAE